MVVLGGCAAPQQRPTVVQNQAAPYCTANKECEAMWIAAGDAISQATGMRVRYQTDSVIETFAPTRAGRMHGRVTKRPLPSGGYLIDADLQCMHYGCESLRNSGLNMFNLEVMSAGIPFRPKRPAAK